MSVVYPYCQLSCVNTKTYCPQYLQSLSALIQPSTRPLEEMQWRMTQSLHFLKCIFLCEKPLICLIFVTCRSNDMWVMAICLGHIKAIAHDWYSFTRTVSTLAIVYQHVCVSSTSILGGIGRWYYFIENCRASVSKLTGLLWLGRCEHIYNNRNLLDMHSHTLLCVSEYAYPLLSVLGSPVT